MIYSFYGMLILLLSLALLTCVVILMWVIYRDSTEDPVAEKFKLALVPPAPIEEDIDPREY